MSELLNRLGWMTSLALCAALIGAGCGNEAGDIEPVEPAPGGIPSTGPDPGMDLSTDPIAPTGDPGGAMTGPDFGSEPIEPSPIEPAPIEPSPIEPAPIEPAPEEPVPAEPAPEEPSAEPQP